MKPALIVILSLTLLTGYSQNYKKDNTAVRVITTLTAWSILNGIGDGLNDNGNKGFGHSVNALSSAILISGMIWSQPDKKDLLNTLISAAGIRFVTFDYAYNLTRGLPLEYTGTTSPGDKLQKRVPANFKTLTKATVLCFTLGFTFNEPKHYDTLPQWGR
jgi:hypothetical protein